jgi:hypothetical protein
MIKGLMITGEIDQLQIENKIIANQKESPLT